MKLRPILFFVTVLTATGQLLAQTTVLTDDFNDGVVDTTKWTLETPFGDSSVSEASGYVEFQNRGRITSKIGVDAPYEVRGRFQLSNVERSNIKIVLRSDGVDLPGASETQGVAIRFQVREDASIANQIAIFHNDLSGTQTGSAQLTTPLSLDQWYDFRIVDNGARVSLFFDGATAETLGLDTSWSAGDLISIYNREGAAAGSSISAGGIARVDRFSAESQAAGTGTVPGTINYQGRLTDGNSDPVTGNVSMNLKLFDAATGGSELYSENIGTVTLDENGVYSFQFGAGGIAGVLTSANSHWLELSIDGTAQSPRERILSVPFAQVAGRVSAGSITAAMLSPDLRSMLNLPNNDQGLVAWFRFDGNANDSSGNGLNGTPIGSVNYTNNRFGEGNSALSGITGAASGPNKIEGTGLDLDGTSHSISLWLRTNYTGNGSNGDWFLKVGEGSQSGKALHVAADYGSALRYSFFFDDFDIATSVSDQNWHHVVVTFDQATQERNIFIDGTLDSSDTAVRGFTGNDYFAFLGANVDLDEVRFYNRVLSAEEESSLFDE